MYTWRKPTLIFVKEFKRGKETELLLDPHFRCGIEGQCS